jgi:hypothetical protein
MRPLLLSKGLCFAFGVIAALAFAAVSITINSTPTPHSFDGWAAVLQQGRQAASKVQLSVAPTIPGGPGNAPRLRYSVAACGPTPFKGVLLLGKDARLDDFHVIAPPAPISGPEPTRPGEPTSVRRTLKLLDVSTGLFLTYSDTQIVRLSLPATKCITTYDDEREPGFFGAAAAVEGSSESAVQIRSEGPLGLWTGPRSTQSWPYLGTLPGVSPYNLGEFRFVRGLSRGAWSRPPGSQFTVDVGALAEKAAVDFARPAPSSSTSLRWSQTQPYAAIARLTDTDSLGEWQTYLVLATIALSIGASFLAALLLRSPNPIDSNAERAKSAGGSTTAPDKLAHPSLGSLVVLALLVWIIERSRNSPN